MKTLEPHIERCRMAHHKALEVIATNDTPGLQLWRKLRRVEAFARYAATQLCNGTIEQEHFDRESLRAKARVQKILGTLPKGFFVNGDPRGYALKIESDTLPEGMHKDWGGYGILAPEIND